MGGTQKQIIIMEICKAPTLRLKAHWVYVVTVDCAKLAEEIWQNKNEQIWKATEIMDWLAVNYIRWGGDLGWGGGGWHE